MELKNQEYQELAMEHQAALQIAVSFGANADADLPHVSPQFSQQPPKSHTSLETQEKQGNFQTIDLVREQPLLSQGAGSTRDQTKAPMSIGSNGTKPVNGQTERPLQSLLKGFRLSQYYRKMCDFGFEKDVYRLGLMNNKERDEMLNQLQLLPGHRERMVAMFNVIDQSNPKSNTLKTLQNAQESKFDGPAAPSQGKSLPQQPRAAAAAQEPPTRQQRHGSSRQDPNVRKRASSRYNRGSSVSSSNNNGGVGNEERASAFSNQIVFDGEQTRAYIKELGTAKTAANSKRSVRTNSTVLPPAMPRPQATPQGSQQQPQSNQKSSQGTVQQSQMSNNATGQDQINLQKMYQGLDEDQKENLNEQFLNNIKMFKGSNPLQKSLGKKARPKGNRRAAEVNNVKAALKKIFPQDRYSKEALNQAHQMVQMYLQEAEQPEKQKSSKSMRTTNYIRKKPNAQNAYAQPPKRPPVKNQQSAAALNKPGTMREASKTRVSMLGPNQHNANNIQKIQTLRTASKGRSHSRGLPDQKSQERQPTGIPGVSNNSQHVGPQKWAVKKAWGRDSSQRSREGSNIGRGVGSFFNRRNSTSAQGSRRGSFSKENPLSQYSTKNKGSLNAQMVLSQQAPTTTSNMPQSELPSIHTPSHMTPDRRPSSTNRRSTASAKRPTNGFPYDEFDPSQTNTPATQQRKKKEQQATIRYSVKKTPKPGIPLSPKKVDRRPVEPDAPEPTKSVRSTPGKRRNSHQAANNPPSGPLLLKPIQAEFEAGDFMEQAPVLSPANVAEPRSRVTPTLDEIISDAAQAGMPNQDISDVVSPDIGKAICTPIVPEYPVGPDHNTADPEEPVADLGEPLLPRDQQLQALQYGHSFNSKKVHQGPTFFNLRLMCVCVGRAIHRHIEFSRGANGGDNWLLDDLKADQQRESINNTASSKPDQMDFTYNFKEQLKITTTPSKRQQKKQDESTKTETTVANDKTTTGEEQMDDTFYSQHFDEAPNGKLTSARPKKGSAVDKDSLEGSKESPYSEIEDDYNDEIGQVDERDDDDFPDDFRDNDLDDLDVEISNKEIEQVERIRMEESFKSTMKREQRRLDNITKSNEPPAQAQAAIMEGAAHPSASGFGLQPFVSQSRLSNFQQIRQAAKEAMDQLEDGAGIDSMRKALETSKMSEKMTEILAVSGEISGQENELDLDYFDDGPKMTKAEFIMAGLDLEPIESMYSQELRQGTAGQRFSMGTKQADESDLQVAGTINEDLGDYGTKAHSNRADLSTQQTQPRKSGRDQMIDSLTRELQKIDRLQKQAQMKSKLTFFDVRYDFESETLDENIKVLEPSAEIISEYCKYVTISSKMENETPVIALVYIERLLRKSSILINKYNWKRLLLVCLCVASKVWDDDSLENVHFPQVMSDITVKMLNKLEQLLLDSFLTYDLVVKGSEYAKYYFIIRTLADDLKFTSQIPEDEAQKQRRKRRKRDEWAEFPLMQPISAQQMQNLQRNAAKAEIYLKERHEKEIIWALVDKFKAKDQKTRKLRMDSTI